MASNLEKTIEKIHQRIADNPKLKNVTHVGISIHKEGFALLQKKSLQILGRVNKQEELEEINSILSEEAEGIEIKNELRVENRS